MCGPDLTPLDPQTRDSVGKESEESLPENPGLGLAWFATGA